MTFEDICTSCGCCCRRVGLNLEFLKKKGFPYNVKKGTTQCEMLTEDNKCSVYRERPSVCNVNSMYYREHSKNGMTKKEHFKIEAQICNHFMDEDNTPLHFRIDIEKI